MTTADGLVAALARAQMAFAQIVKAHENPHFKSKYADLSDVLAAVRPALNAEGIWLTQPLETDDDGRVRLFTRLEGHGEKREAALPVHLDNMTPQQLLSTLTYYRRGMLSAMLGVAAEDDDDGNAAQTAPARPSMQAAAVAIGKAMAAVGDPHELAAANPPEKPLAAMTAGEMARYGESIGVRVTGSKADILRQLEPIVKAATGEEPFDLPETYSPTAPPPPGYPIDDRPEFDPVVANTADEAGSVRRAVNSSMKADK